jgi:hypothetical protein
VPKSAEKLHIDFVAIDALIPYARNSRTHSSEQVAQIAASIREFGFTNPVLIDDKGGIIAGHGRVLAARQLKLDTAPCIILGHLTETQKRAYIIADNKLALNAGWDAELLAVEFADLADAGFDLELTGFTQEEIDALGVDGVADEEPGEAKEPKGNLSDRFMIPPFSVLNSREGWWQNRKNAWLAVGIKSELGRGGGAATPKHPPTVTKNKDGTLNYAGAKGQSPRFDAQRQAAAAGTARGGYAGADSADSEVQVSGTSIFDPVLCEIAYRWFSPVGGLILDPFAGGSVRGIVASKIGRQYIGHELRQEQVDANRLQGGELCGDDEHPPAWIAGDSRNIDTTCADVHADMVFSCPPYADLEVYSDDPKDLSTMKYSDFRAVYFEIIKKACARLKPDSFACFVVGEVRDKKGNYIDFVGDTVQAFRDAGLEYYNEAILVTHAGSLPIRAGKQFSASRKLGKTHQNILIFVKGNGKKAADRCGTVDVDESIFDSIEAVSGNEG